MRATREHKSMVMRSNHRNDGECMMRGGDGIDLEPCPWLGIDKD